jgi:multiple antibiotic resistance protein
MSWFLEGLTYVLSTVGALLPIVNPLSAVGLVMSITADLSEQERNEQIRRACIYMFCILTAFLVAGGLIMNFFGISIPGLRIAGGMIVSYLGFRMLFPESAAISGQERAEARAKADVSFTPLAMPSLSGPGSIAVVIGMSTTVQMSQHIVVGYLLVAIGIAAGRDRHRDHRADFLHRAARGDAPGQGARRDRHERHGAHHGLPAHLHRHPVRHQRRDRRRQSDQVGRTSTSNAGLKTQRPAPHLCHRLDSGRATAVARTRSSGRSRIISTLVC